MRNLSIIIVLFLSGVLNINAQEVVLKKGHNISELHKGAYYRLDPEFRKKYVGTWISEDEKFKIFIITKKVFLKGPDIHMEILIGDYCYDFLDCNFSNNKFSLSVGSINYENGTTAEFIFDDQKKSKRGNAELRLIEGNKAKWTLKNRERSLFGEFDPTFSVPTEAIMTKIEH